MSTFYPTFMPSEVQQILQAALDSPLLEKTLSQAPGATPQAWALVTNSLAPSNLNLTKAGQPVLLYSSAEKAGNMPFIELQALDAGTAKATLRLLYGDTKIEMTLRNRTEGWTITKYKSIGKNGKKTLRLFSADVDF